MRNENKEIIVLSKSRKHGGYCVAGIDCYNRSFIRLISNNPLNHYAVTDDEIKDNNGEVVEVFDNIVVVTSSNNINLPYQPENLLLNTNYTVLNKGKFNKMNLRRIVDNLCNKYEYIFFTSDRSISISELKRINLKDIHSLEIIKPDKLVLRIKDIEKQTLRGNILYNGIWYNNFSITDSKFEKKYFIDVINSLYGSVTIKNPYLLISLGECFNGCHYKLIASILDI